MTDWLEQTLDRDFGEAVPEGFAARVVAEAHEQDGAEEGYDSSPRPGKVLRFPTLIGVAAAAALLMAAGFWIGSGSKPVEPTLIDPGSSQMANLELAELYSNRELLSDIDFLSDAELELAFQDEVSSAWILSETVAAHEADSESAEGEDE